MPQYDHNGRLTRTGAIEVIKGGGSVCVRGVVYSSAGALPSEAVFAKGDPQHEAQARANLEKEIKEKQAQLNALNVGTITEAKPSAEAPAPPPDNLDALTVVELKKLASERHVPGYGTMNKAELVAALK